MSAVALNQTFVNMYAGRFDDAKAIVEIIGTSVTTLAIVVGGVWAYFKFARGRTFAPRIEVMVSGQFRAISDKQLLHARVAVRNIGASKVDLLQKGTGLRVSSVVAQSDKVPSAVEWAAIRVFTILAKHSWIEPNETISDDLLLDLGVEQTPPILCEVRLVWRGSKESNTVVNAKAIITEDSRVQSTSPL